MSLIPNGLIGIFHRLNPSGCTKALRMTQPLTEIGTRGTSSTYGSQPCHFEVVFV